MEKYLLLTETGLKEMVVDEQGNVLSIKDIEER